jgi:hypothetical protein
MTAELVDSLRTANTERGCSDSARSAREPVSLETRCRKGFADQDDGSFGIVHETTSCASSARWAQQASIFAMTVRHQPWQPDGARRHAANLTAQCKLRLTLNVGHRQMIRWLRLALMAGSNSGVGTVGAQEPLGRLFSRRSARP